MWKSFYPASGAAGTQRMAQVATLAFVALLAGCATASAPQSSFDKNRSGNYVVVENHNWQDLRVYAVNSAGARFRLGNVTTNQRRRFRLPSSVTSSGFRFELVATFIGSSQVQRTGSLPFYPNRDVYWTVGNHAVTSHVMVR